MSIALGAPSIWKQRGRGFWQRLKAQWQLILMVIPAVVLLFLFCYLPMAGIQIAWKEYNFGKGILGSPWVGWKYFHFLLRQDFWLLLRNTVVIAGLKFVFQFPAPIILALLLNEVRQARFKRVVQTVTYLPHFLSWVVIVGIIQAFFALDGGVINSLLRTLGLDPIFLLGDKNLFYPLVVFSSLWKEVGWGCIIYLAAISGIDPQLYEAAQIDGAGRWRQMLHITMPCISPVISILLVLSIPGLISAGFDQIWLMQNAYNIGISEVIDTYVLRLGLLNSQFSFTAAIGFFTSLVATTLVLVANSISRRLGGQTLW